MLGRMPTERPDDRDSAALSSSRAEIEARLTEAFALHQRGDLVAAERLYSQVLKQEPRHFHALYWSGLLARQSGRLERGTQLLAQAADVDPRSAPAHFELGNALATAKQQAAAVASYDRVIALQPAFAMAYHNRGVALKELMKVEEALASYDRALALDPGYATAHNNRGVVLMALQRIKEALASYDRAIALKPDYAMAHYNRGNALLNLRRLPEALASYDRAIALRPDDADAVGNRATVLNDLERYDEAIAGYDRAIALKPGQNQAEGARIYAKMRLCDWRGFEPEARRLIGEARRGGLVIQPFPLLALAASAGDQLRYTRAWAASKYPPSDKPLWRGGTYDHERIRIAYVSGDFRDHAVAHLAAGMFERHDRSRFEIIGVSSGDDDGSDMRKRLVAAFDQFHDVRGQSDRDVARLLRDREVDIAIDLSGYTRNTRFPIFARRAAPIQASYLAYPATTGAPYIDYLIADRIVLPVEQRQFYSEKIVHLPECYQVNDATRAIAAETPTRQEAGLPEGEFVFCCFNNSYKILPDLFDRWMRMLKQVEGSVLWLLESNPTATANLGREAVARDVAPERLVFARRAKLAHHLARHRLADLFLDTLPYGAHTTASDALWAGLPILTCLGETFAGRVAASLLHAIGLPELVTTSLADYERLAIELATQPEKLTALRQRLADNRLAAPLFDTARLTRSIEAAYRAMYDRHRAGLPPDHLVIASS
jgi:protein O-GlcNAc transferase